MKSPMERFLSRIDFLSSPHGCWLWTGYLDKDGYGQFTYEKVMRAHRASILLHGGELISGLVVDHLCRVRNCVNPLHLKQVTHLGNSRSGLNGVLRKSCAQGHPRTPENIRITPGRVMCVICSRSRSNAWKSANRESYNERRNERRRLLRKLKARYNGDTQQNEG